MTYWDDRSKLKYYDVVKQYIDCFSPGDTIIDVGCRDTPMVLHGDFSHRFTIDLIPRPELEGVTAFVADWLTFEVPRKATLICCLQTLEHIKTEEMKAFTSKLFESSHKVLVSVPYKWSETACEHHYHDPIDEEKLAWMMRRYPQVSVVVTEDNGFQRLVAVY